VELTEHGVLKPFGVTGGDGLRGWLLAMVGGVDAEIPLEVEAWGNVVVITPTGMWRCSGRLELLFWIH
jgi:hypothetical protein